MLIVCLSGTFITEWDEGAERMAALLSSEQTITTAVEKMTAIAQYYNFDGWLINIENKIKVGVQLYIAVSLPLKFDLCLEDLIIRRVGNILCDRFLGR